MYAPVQIDRQRIRIAVTGAAAGHRLMLDRRDLGPADSGPLVLAGPGAHRLALVDPSGRTIDGALFTVR